MSETFARTVDSTLFAWLTLAMTPGIGPVKFAAITNVVSPSYLLTQSIAELLQAGFTQKQALFIEQASGSAPPKWLVAIEQWLSQSRAHHCIALYSESYPALLREIDAPPPVLFVAGDLDCLSSPQVAMVGSRHATIDGRNIAQRFAADFAMSKVTVTSGLAKGIDTSAHKGALNADGLTVAVLGSGHQHIYPKSHQGLAKQIITSGALVSEFAPWVAPRAGHFPRRNRIISGLSKAVLVVEAAQKSGSLITARFAIEQNRELFVIPGSNCVPQAMGSNELIRQGATLVQNSQQLLEQLDLQLPTQQLAVQQLQHLQSNHHLPYPKLLANLGVEPTPVDILSQRTHIKVQELMTQLVELELSGHVASVAGGYIRIRGNPP